MKESLYHPFPATTYSQTSTWFIGMLSAQFYSGQLFFWSRTLDSSRFIQEFWALKLVHVGWTKKTRGHSPVKCRTSDPPQRRRSEEDCPTHRAELVGCEYGTDVRSLSYTPVGRTPMAYVVVGPSTPISVSLTE